MHLSEAESRSCARPACSKQFVRRADGVQAGRRGERFTKYKSQGQSARPAMAREAFCASAATAAVLSSRCEDAIQLVPGWHSIRPCRLMPFWQMEGSIQDWAKCLMRRV